MKENKKKVLSLFSGCGGMDIGFEGGFKILKSLLNDKINSDWINNADGIYYNLKDTIFKTVFSNDISSHAQVAWEDYFYRKYNSNLDAIFKLGSIVDIVKQYNYGATNIFPSNIDLVTGGFPCQDFSVAGKRKGFDSHKNHLGDASSMIPTEETRGKLYMWMKQVVEITSPKMFIAENVKGLSNLGRVKEIIQSDFSKINGDGYLVLSPKVLHAGNYGIPQSRERIFFIGFKKSALTQTALEELSKKDILEKYSPYPVATHRINGEMHYSSVESNMISFIKSKEVLLDLLEPEDSNDLSQRYYSKAKYMGTHCQGQKEIDLERLAPTIRAEHHGNIEFRRLNKNKGGIYHGELDNGKIERRLTLRECARIQTFPDDFNFVLPSDKSNTRFLLSPSQGYKLVGNAVPPLLAYHIAKKVEANWEFYFNS